MEQPKCKYCGSPKMFTKKNGPHIGLYCQTCGKWAKWVHQNEIIKYRNMGIYDEFGLYGTNYKIY